MPPDQLKDHSVIGFLEETGRLSEDDAMRHPKRNEINKALGFEENIDATRDFIETGESPFLPDDVILICSDGLSDMLHSSIVSSILLDGDGLEKQANKLVDAANEAGGNDNITLVLVKNNNQPSPKIALKPVERKTSDQKTSLTKQKKTVAKNTNTPAKNKRSFITFVSLFVVGFVLVFLFQRNTALKNIGKSYSLMPARNVDTGFNSLINGINDTNKIHSLKTNLTFRLSAPVFITKDSFHLIGNAATLTPDSTYKGAAIIIDKNSKQVILDSIIIKNFDTGMVIEKNNVILKNVTFINCRVPVQYKMLFTDSTVSGRFKDSIFIPLPNHKKP